MSPDPFFRECIYIGSNRDLNPLFSGVQQCPPGHTIRNRLHDYWLFCCVESGRGTFTIEDNNCKNVITAMEPGDAFLAASGMVHSYAADGREPWKYAWIAFDGELAAGYTCQTDFRMSPVIRAERSFCAMLEELTAASMAEVKPSVRYLMASETLCRLLSALIRSSRVPNDGVTRGKYSDYVWSAMQIMRTRYDQELTIASIAKQVGICREYLSAVFRRETGTTPQQFLLNIRIKKAGDLLRDSRSPVGVVCMQVGIPDPSHFSNLFRRMTGLSPTRYREEAAGRDQTLNL